MKQNLYRIRYKMKHYPGRLNNSLTTTQTVVLSFLAVIVVGSFLLSLPVSQAGGALHVRYIDCLFTAVSATCVTGLVTVNTATQWTIFGQVVILVMIQIGGLSFITLFMFFIVNLGKKINMKQRMLIQASLNQNNVQGMVRIVKLAIGGTMLIEGIGSVVLFLFFRFEQNMPVGKAIYFGLFHAVSAFCNAGFDIIGAVSLQEFMTSPVMNISIMLLIVSGGIGFTVWKDIIAISKDFLYRKLGKRYRLSLHTKLALITTASLILLGTIYFFATEFANSALAGLTFSQKLGVFLFQ